MTKTRVISVEISDASGTTVGTVPQIPAGDLRGAAVTPEHVKEAVAARLGRAVALRKWGIDAVGRVQSVVLEEIESHAATALAAADSPGLAWEQPGWFYRRRQDIDAWVRRQTGSELARLDQIRHGPIGAVLYVVTQSGQRFWYKEALSIFGAEADLLAIIGAQMPGVVPTCLGPVSAGFMTAPLEPLAVHVTTPWWARLGALQHNSQNWSQPLASIALPRLELEPLAQSMTDPFYANLWAQVSSEGSNTIGSDGMVQALMQICALGLPEVLIHGDLHADNAIRTASGWVFLDWSDSCLANPFLDLVLTDRYGPSGFAAACRYFADLWGCRGRMSDADLLRAVRVSGVARLLHQYRLIHDATDPAYRPWAQYRMVDWLRWLGRREA